MNETWDCCMNHLQKDEQCPICGEKYYDSVDEKISNVKWVEQTITILDKSKFKSIAQKIEFCGRVCYDSIDKISNTPQECDRFLSKRIEEKHLSIFEHGRVCIPKKVFDQFVCHAFGECKKDNAVDKNSSHWEDLKRKYDLFSRIDEEDENNYNINVRDILQYGFIEIPWQELKESEDYFTVMIKCNRAIANEFVRHRKMSFSQASTRYIKYLGDFEFIKPYDQNMLSLYEQAFEKSQFSYQKLIEGKVKAQFARDVLNLGFATTLIISGTINDWDHVYQQRSSKAAHPQIKELMGQIYNEFLNMKLKS